MIDIWIRRILPALPLLILIAPVDGRGQNSTQVDTIIINEINFRSANEFETGDWLELHNPGPKSLELAGWRFADDNDDNVFRIPVNVAVPPGGFLILCNDIESFRIQFPNLKNVIGDFDFGLSRDGELLRLFDANDRLVDAVLYRSEQPWPDDASGTGRTLELINPAWDNRRGDFWRASRIFGGTPGAVNSALDDTTRYSLPEEGALGLTLPNPFAVEARIRYELAGTGRVQLFVLNEAGELVITLVDTWQRMGIYHHSWSPSGVSSGVYFFALFLNGKPLASREALYIPH